ncbi:MAG: methyltransferase domain-containing protein [Mycetocola sp.]
MARLISATSDAIELSLAESERDLNNIDVSFDGHRVWSLALPEPDGADDMIVLEWPSSLRPYLDGSTLLGIADSSSGHTIAEADVTFSDSGSRTSVQDVRGRWLAVNKWNRLGPTFEGDQSGIQTRLLESSARLIADLESWGYPTYIVGGTLLGAVRNGKLLPHDDDIDLAVLSAGDNAVDVALENLRIEAQLVEAGYVSVRHSLAHLQVTFFRDDGSTDHYIDIFAGFFFGDLYGQPFALLGPSITKSDLVPVSRMTVQGHVFPAPAVPEAWLAFAYGENWRVPDPSFTFVTPRTTTRRFTNWFGVFNKSRVYWEKHYEQFLSRADVRSRHGNSAQFIEMLPQDANVVDIGSGDGFETEKIAASARRVVGVDYSHEALRLARENAPENVTYEYLNFNDRLAVLAFAARIIRSRQVWHFNLQYVIQGLSKPDRANVYLFLRQTLRGSSFAYLSFDTNLPEDYARLNPTSWHYPVSWLTAEAARYGLDVRVLGTGTRASELGERATATAVITRRADTASDDSRESATE